MLQNLDQLFAASEPPGDETGCLGPIADLLAEFGPSLVLLVGCNGRVTAADRTGTVTHGDEIGAVAARLLDALKAQHACFFEFAGRKGRELAFGVRLSARTVGSVLGGLVAPGAEARARLAALTPCLVTCGELAWQVLEERASVRRTNARKDQLRVEHETLRSAHIKALAQALEEQQKRIDAERLYSHRLQREVEIRSAELKQALEDAHGKSQQLREYSMALERANATLEYLMQEANAANAAKSRFLATISHEIRSPLTAILGYTDLLIDGLPGAGVHGDYLGIIRQNGRHLLAVLNDILDLSKIDSGNFQVDRVPCSPAAVLADVVSLMRIRASAKGLSLTLEFAGPLPETVLTDPTRLRQILVNLVDNAIKFTEAGEIRIIASLRDRDGPQPKLACDVVDPGIGMTADQVERLFQPFQQADPSTSRKFGGTGLGLAVSKRLAKLLGGDISVVSALGKGSTFTMTVETGPLSEGKDGKEGHSTFLQDRLVREQRTVEKAECPVLPPNCRILLAEDGPDNRRLFSFLLKKAGAEVVAVGDGKRATELALATLPGQAGPDAAPAEPFDVVLMDMEMPVMDGFEATRRLRSAGYTGPILALTAYAMAEDRQKCLDAGCDDYAAKPIDQPRLLATLARYVKAVDGQSSLRNTLPSCSSA